MTADRGLFAGAFEVFAADLGVLTGVTFLGVAFRPDAGAFGDLATGLGLLAVDLGDLTGVRDLERVGVLAVDFGVVALGS